MKKIDRYIMILAGGSGERFWPVSRQNKPKQLIALLGKTSFLQQTVQRALLAVPVENILIVTNKTQVPGVRKQCPSIPKENIVAEPCRRDTCAAIALGAAIIGQRNPDATMAVLPADHFIADNQAFKRTLMACFKLASKENLLLTIGIHPEKPATAFGYIKQGKPFVGDSSKADFFKVRQFVEKPPLAKAKRYLKSGQYRWNAGMFVWSIRSLIDAFDTHIPAMGVAYRRWEKVAGNPRKLHALLRIEFPSVQRISIDFALMEKAKNVVMADGSFGWDDLGSWTALSRHLATDDQGNCADAELIKVDSENNIVFDARSKHPNPITLVGVKDCIVVMTDDATMVASISNDQQIKDLVAKLAKDERYKHLI